MVLFVSSPQSELTKERFAGNSSAVTTTQQAAGKKELLKDETWRCSNPNTRHGTNKSTTAGKSLKDAQNGCFYSSEAKQCFDSRRAHSLLGSEAF